MSKEKISVIGLGYVGLPVAVAFAKKFEVVGFDVNEARVNQLKSGNDSTGEVDPEELNNPNLLITSNPEDLKAATFHIVAVPTPVDKNNRPNLRPMIEASKTVGKYLKRGDVVVYESTVYPGVCEEECIPVLEEYSSLKNTEDFKIGYSPERINPGDKTHTFTKILKIVSGQDEETLNRVAAMYESVVEPGVFKASSIKVAEAAKVIENTQRDLNIALVNELAIIFDKLGIKTQDVLEAAGTKWNFLKFQPGLVGGHCIGVDPYYLTYKAEAIGYHPQIILSGRRINDSMGKYVAERTIKEIINNGAVVKGSVVTILGLTFKEDCPDLRNSKVVDIINELREYGVEIQAYDPYACKEVSKAEMGVEITALNELKPASAVIFAVKHKQFLELGSKDLSNFLTPGGVIVDVKNMLNSKVAAENGYKYWSL